MKWLYKFGVKTDEKESLRLWFKIINITSFESKLMFFPLFKYKNENGYHNQDISQNLLCLNIIFK